MKVVWNTFKPYWCLLNDLRHIGEDSRGNSSNALSQQEETRLFTATAAYVFGPKWRISIFGARRIIESAHVGYPDWSTQSVATPLRWSSRWRHSAGRRHPAAFLWPSARDHRVKATATKGTLQDVRRFRRFRRCRKSMRQVTSLAAKRSHFKIVLSSLCVASLNVQIIANLLAFSSGYVSIPALGLITQPNHLKLWSTQPPSIPYRWQGLSGGNHAKIC